MLDNLKILQEQLEETITLMSRAQGPSVSVLKSLSNLEGMLNEASAEVHVGRKVLKKALVEEVKSL